jgi:hypothetical protein
VTTTMGSTSRRKRFILYGVSAAVLVVLVIAGLIVRRQSTSDSEAQRKAEQLVAALSAAGAQAPSVDEVIGLLGADGGAVCASPNKALTQAAAQAQMANGSGGPGTRPVIADSRLVYGELLVISIYCPDQLAGFQQFVDELKTSDAAGE